MDEVECVPAGCGGSGPVEAVDGATVGDEDPLMRAERPPRPPRGRLTTRALLRAAEVPTCDVEASVDSTGLPPRIRRSTLDLHSS